MTPPMRRRFDADLLRWLLAGVLLLAGAGEVFAQARPRPRRPASSPGIEIGGYVMAGVMNFTAADSFDVILGQPSGSIVGGGGRVGLPWRTRFGGVFIDVGAWRFRDSGDRVFIFGGQEFDLNIPVTIIVTPIELSAGWQFRLPRAPRLRPYAAAGYSSYGYQETSQFASGTENVDDRVGGYHVSGGVEFRITRWLGVAGDANWATVPDALGHGGVSADFDETDLGGTSLRLKITIGR